MAAADLRLMSGVQDPLATSDGDGIYAALRFRNDFPVLGAQAGMADSKMVAREDGKALLLSKGPDRVLVDVDEGSHDIHATLRHVPRGKRL